MTKTQLGLATAATLALALGLVWQHRENATRRAEITALSHAHPQVSAVSSDEMVVLDETLRQLDAVLATAATTPPLTSEQLERQQLDTFIRKGELDDEYAHLFRKLRLPAHQLEALKALLVEYNQTRYNAINLAVREGLPDIAPFEIEKLADAATHDINASIARLVGDQNASTVRDYIALRCYRIRAGGFIAGDALTDAESFEKHLTPEYDEQLDKIARTLREKAPTYYDRYQSPWPDLFPEEALAAIEPLLPERSRAFFRDTNRDILARRRMAEISRDAALQGKIKVREDSLRDYPLATGASQPGTK